MKVTTSHSYSCCSHLRMTDVSKPPLYASTTLFTLGLAEAEQERRVARASRAVAPARRGATALPRKQVLCAAARVGAARRPLEVSARVTGTVPLP